MPNPIIQLKFNRKLDQDLAWDFYSNPNFGGCNFWVERALPYHPKLSKFDLTINPKNFLRQYVLKFYDSHFDEINKLSQKTPRYLNESQDIFFRIVDKVFNHYPWPRKKFIGIFSIFDFCPRFLDWGGFQIFLYDNRSTQLFTIFHEMLHFIFYDFAQKTLPKKFRKMDTDKGRFWDLAEVFNAVIQDTPDFIKIHGKINNIGYPDHQALIKNGKKIWNKNQDLSRWIVEMIKII